LLTSHSAEETAAMNPEYQRLLSNREDLLEMIEGLYNFWRRLERFFYIEAPKRSMYAKNRLHHAQFIKANEEFKDLVLHVYRSISENVTGQNPRVYRQLPAGANIGMLTEKIDWDCPAAYAGLADVPFIRLSLIEPPLIIYPVMNTRKGSFEETGKVADGTFDIDSGEWFCFPAKVGDLTAFIFFHQDFISLGLSLSNLFEIATYEEIDGKRPDLMIAFGLPKDRLAGSTMFYEDKENGMLVGMVGHSEEVDYFGYFKKMTLTLHNIAMLNRGRLPLHGAMAYIKLKDGGSANVVIVGDSGAGKSETIEALRTLAEDHICEMRVIFDDMGSLGINADGRVAGYGTEIGAFVRLDDLQAGYAYEEIDRSIFMNPHKINSRLVIPITRYEGAGAHVLRQPVRRAAEARVAREMRRGLLREDVRVGRQGRTDTDAARHRGLRAGGPEGRVDGAVQDYPRDFEEGRGREVGFTCCGISEGRPAGRPFCFLDSLTCPV
ncbi:MAG: hypothetical protein HZC51_10605, partial [Nitrospirae bacterium]|nr:hypothetical protein [Nitrospirota bacterium]